MELYLSYILVACTIQIRWAERFVTKSFSCGNAYKNQVKRPDIVLMTPSLHQILPGFKQYVLVHLQFIAAGHNIYLVTAGHTIYRTSVYKTFQPHLLPEMFSHSCCRVGILIW